MKNLTISFSIIAFSMMALYLLAGFKPMPAAALKTGSVNQSGDISIFTYGTGFDGISTYTGTVRAQGAINASGTYVMPTEVIGMALHCLVEITFPDGTVTLRMNCNMVTFNGRWKVLEGTGAYRNLKGGGSLVMPNDNDEILTGSISGM